MVTGKVKFHKISACDTQAVIINSDKQDKMTKGAQLKVLWICHNYSEKVLYSKRLQWIFAAFIKFNFLYLHSHKSVIDNNFFCQKVCPNSCFILVTKLLLHILVHQRRLANPARLCVDNTRSRERASRRLALKFKNREDWL